MLSGSFWPQMLCEIIIHFIIIILSWGPHKFPPGDDLLLGSHDLPCLGVPITFPSVIRLLGVFIR